MIGGTFFKFFQNIEWEEIIGVVIISFISCLPLCGHTGGRENIQKGGIIYNSGWGYCD